MRCPWVWFVLWLLALILGWVGPSRAAVAHCDGRVIDRLIACTRHDTVLVITVVYVDSVYVDSLATPDTGAFEPPEGWMPELVASLREAALYVLTIRDPAGREQDWGIGRTSPAGVWIGEKPLPPWDRKLTLYETAVAEGRDVEALPGLESLTPWAP